jgi:hypothetical protein
VSNGAPVVDQVHISQQYLGALRKGYERLHESEVNDVRGRGRLWRRVAT